MVLNTPLSPSHVNMLVCMSSLEHSIWFGEIWTLLWHTHTHTHIVIPAYCNYLIMLTNTSMNLTGIITENRYHNTGNFFHTAHPYNGGGVFWGGALLYRGCFGGVCCLGPSVWTVSQRKHSRVPCGFFIYLFVYLLVQFCRHRRLYMCVKRTDTFNTSFSCLIHVWKIFFFLYIYLFIYLFIYFFLAGI